MPLSTEAVVARPVVETTSVLSKPWYWNYVLGALTLCYIVNVMDRSQILAASIQSIKNS